MYIYKKHTLANHFFKPGKKVVTIFIADISTNKNDIDIKNQLKILNNYSISEFQMHFILF